MRPESLEFLKAIVNCPSPSGFEQKAAALYRSYTEPFAHKVWTDLHGNTYAALNPDAPMKIMLAGHIDEIGFIVHHIDDKGLLYFQKVGGHDGSIVVGQRVWLHGKERVPGVIGRKAIHLLEGEERKKAPEVHDMWIDIGAANKEEATALVRLGDCVTYQSEFQHLAGTRATARGFDNKMGTFIVAEALRLLAEGGLDPQVGVFAVATVQEEIGLRGARTAAGSLGAQAGLAVDVTHAVDYPGVSASRYGAIDLGKGPTILRGANANPVVADMCVDAAEEGDIPYQIEVEAGGTGTDANAMQIVGSGMATGLLGVPLRYMHTPCEVLELPDVENCARLMAAFCWRVKSDTNFVPR